MPEKTDLHKWQYPVRGDGNYESILTALFESIDRDTILVDDDGSRSDYTPKNNALYLTSDTDELYRGDGSSWNLIGTVGGGGSGTDGSYTDADAIAAINDDVDHGSTAPHDYTSSASGLSDVSPDSDASAHHEAFTTTDHDGRNHESALSSTFGNASVGEHIVKTSGGWGTESPTTASTDSPWVDKDDDTILELSDSYNGVNLNGIDIGQAQFYSLGGPVTNSGGADGPLITNLAGPGLTINGSNELEATGSTSGTSSSMTASREAFYVVDGQPLYSTDSTQVYIDPDNGTDSSSTAGTQADPYRTIGYATQQNLAFYQRHGFSIILDNPNPSNPYDGALMPPTCLGYVDIDSTNFEIIGDPNDPSAYPFERGQKLRGAFNFAHDQPNCIIEGVELGGIGIEGQMFFRNCNVTGWDANNVGLTSYSGNYSFKSCTFTNQCDAEIYAGSSKTVSFEDCTHNGNTILDNANSSGLQIFLDGDPGIPIFPSQNDYEETPAYINTDSTADIVGNATPYPGA